MRKMCGKRLEPRPGHGHRGQLDGVVETGMVGSVGADTGTFGGASGVLVVNGWDRFGWEGTVSLALTAAGAASPGLAVAGSLRKNTKPMTTTRPTPTINPSLASLGMTGASGKL